MRDPWGVGHRSREDTLVRNCLLGQDPAADGDMPIGIGVPQHLVGIGEDLQANRQPEQQGQREAEKRKPAGVVAENAIMSDRETARTS